MFKTILLVALFGVTFVHGQTAIIINRLVELRSKIFIALLLLFGVGLPCSAMAAPHEPVAADTVRFVDDVSLFDVCYPVYRRTADLLLTGSSYNPQDGWLRDVDHPDDSTFVRVGMRRYLFDARREVYAVCLAFHRLQTDTAYDEAAEKARLVRQLETFRDTAAVLPTLYGQIEAEYGGDAVRYVEALFAHSAVTDRKTMRRVCGKPSVERMQADMGFQFVVSKLLYRQWEAQGRPAEGVGHYVIRNLWRTPTAEH